VNELKGHMKIIPKRRSQANSKKRLKSLGRSNPYLPNIFDQFTEKDNEIKILKEKLAK